jgi:VIT1/CCC1 family predicted Fe2+/Mn2+ transporter
MANDALASHARDEFGLSEISAARPVQAALASAATFSVGAAAPLALVVLSPLNLLLPMVALGSLVSLALLGDLGGSRRWCGAAQTHGSCCLLGILAMVLTTGIGAIVGKVV